MNETYDLNTFVTQFSSIFSGITDKGAPMNSICVSERCFPWVNANLKKLTEKWDKLEELLLKASHLSLRPSIGISEVKDPSWTKRIYFSGQFFFLRQVQTRSLGTVSYAFACRRRHCAGVAVLP